MRENTCVYASKGTERICHTKKRHDFTLGAGSRACVYAEQLSYTSEN